MLVAVFRARPDGERTAARLHALGHDALLAPVFEIVPTGAGLPEGSFDGVIFTSAHGVEALRPDDAARLAASVAFCVGDRTADCARSAGFARIHNARADADRLAGVVDAAFSVPARLLLVAGRDRKPAIERRLAAAGHELAVAEVYAAEAVMQWPDPVNAALAGTGVSAALHYSRRSAALALACAATGGVTAQLMSWRHLCLSEDAAEPLRRAGVAAIGMAAEPNEASLLGLLPG